MLKLKTGFRFVSRGVSSMPTVISEGSLSSRIKQQNYLKSDSSSTRAVDSLKDRGCRRLSLSQNNLFFLKGGAASVTLSSSRGQSGPHKHTRKSFRQPGRTFPLASSSASLLHDHKTSTFILHRSTTSIISTFAMPPLNIAIVGSGNWGSAIAKIVGKNVKEFDSFNNNVKMYVFEEIVNGQKLSEIINTTHENVKYLPGHKIPENVVAVPDVVETCQDADILIFVLPHKFVRPTCRPLVGKIKPTAIGLSLIKGFDILEGGGVALISSVINSMLNIDVCVLMGANLAGEVADEKFCETTIGSKNAEKGLLLKRLIQTSYFRVSVVDDIETIEICGALKNIVAVGAGFIDGLDYGDNTKAAVIRLGLKEIIAYAETFYPGGKLSTFFESCGIADLITTCYGGRNRRVAEAFVRSNKTVEQLEKEMLNGQRMQGPQTAEEVYLQLKNINMLDRFPLFVAIHRICIGEIPATEMINCIRNHPEHIKNSPDVS